jgi:predicted Zn-dependent peptidase
LLVRARVEETRAVDAAQRMIAAVEGLYRDAASDREAFVRARKKVLGVALAQQSGASAVARRLADGAARGQSPQRAQELAARVSALSPVDVGNVAADDLPTAHRVIVVKGKRTSVDAIYAELDVVPVQLEEDSE